ITLVIGLKVRHGLVLGADSASTLTLAGQYHNSYFNAEKLFNLRKGLPLGALTYGLRGLGGRSIASQAKDLRLRFGDSANKNWFMEPTQYTVKEVTEKANKFFFGELYEPQIK